MSTESSVPPKQTLFMRELWPLGPLNRWIVLAVETSQRKTLRSPPTEVKRELSLFDEDLVKYFMHLETSCMKMEGIVSKEIDSRHKHTP